MRLYRGPVLLASGPAELLAYAAPPVAPRARLTRRFPSSVSYLFDGFAALAGPGEAAAFPAPSFLPAEVFVTWTQLLSRPPCLGLN